jgi:hypothetical protein
MRFLKLSLLFLCATLFLAAQPTINMYQRVWMIKTKHGRGPAFAADVDGREYWITAKHVLTGAKGKPFGTITEKTVTLELLDPGGDGERWLTNNFTVLQSAEDVDIVVLAPQKSILEDVHPSPELTGSLLFGGNCEFMGFPYGGGWRLKTEVGRYWVAYTKKCSISGMDSDAHLRILDGINNVGFSGGPVFIGTGKDLKIVGVVSGYWLEPTEVIKGKPVPAADPKDVVNVNTGFILAYDIKIANDLIKKNPIGPTRQAKK